MPLRTAPRWLARLIPCLLLASPAAQAIDVGDMSYFMAPDTHYLTKRVSNKGNQASVYTVTVEETAPPYADASTWRAAPGELLYGPRQLILRPHRSNWLRLYYNGPADDRARFYRITFTELRTSLRETDDAVNLTPHVSLDTILVVQPREPRQSYRVAGTRLVNDGNTVYLATVFGHCADPL